MAHGGLLALLALVDWTIRPTDLLIVLLTALLLPAVRAFARALFEMRDTLRDTTRLLGTADPPVGALGDIVHLKREARRHRDWLIKAAIIDPGDRT